MKKRFNIQLLIAVLVTTLISSSGCNKNDNNIETIYPVTIGVILPMDQEKGILREKALRTAINIINASGGVGEGLLAASVGQKKAREIWFMTRQYDAQEALAMGLINTVVPVDQLEAETVSWSREMLRNSPMALRLLKSSMNAADDGLAGIQQLAGDATLLFYLSEEGQEGRDAYKEKRAPDFGKFPKRP